MAHFRLVVSMQNWFSIMSAITPLSSAQPFWKSLYIYRFEIDNDIAENTIFRMRYMQKFPRLK